MAWEINKKIKEKPERIVLAGVVYSMFGVLLSLFIFRGYAGLVSVFLTTMAAIPFMYFSIKYEEEKEFHIEKEALLIKEHGKVLKKFMLLFLGICAGFVLMQMLLPGNVVNSCFKIQKEVINRINSEVYFNGNISGYFYSRSNVFFTIVKNNLRLVVICLLFSFLYGFGAIFIMVWNASIIATAINQTMRQILENINLMGKANIFVYVYALPLSFMRYFLHGIFEIMAYFTAGLAGAIISIAIIRHNFKTKKFQHIVLDSADLIMISIILILIGAFIEAYITPLLF